MGDGKMDDIILKYKEKPALKEPIIVEGLPGVGNVGKLAAEHLKDETKATKFATMYSKYFPPQVLVDEKGVIRLVSNDFYYLKGQKKEQKDVIIIVGDYQGLTPEGQYALSAKMLDVAEEFGVKRIYTLGGYGLGKMIEKPRVLGAATDEDFVHELKKQGVVFSKGEPGSGIVGASGLLLGLGALRGMRCACLMGETSGYFVDPKSARAVLEILSKILKIEISFTELEEKALQIDRITNQLKEMEQVVEPETKGEDLHYIG